jgi:hypothetical protein
MLAYLKMHGCAVDASLTIKRLPTSAALVDRARIEETRSAANLDPCITLARELLMDELQKRFFDARPSDAAMILMHMTKQGLRTSQYLTALQVDLARTIYLKWLRNAHDVLRGKSPVPLRTSPRKPSKLFRAAYNEPDDVGFDEVTDEVARWEALKSNEIECFRKTDGLLDEFALVWVMRLRFPLHFFVFKQTAAHLPFEANVERVFSVAGYLSDPCRNAEHLVDMVMAALNRKACDPSIEAIRGKYYEMFRGAAGAQSAAANSDSDSSS